MRRFNESYLSWHTSIDPTKCIQDARTHKNRKITSTSTPVLRLFCRAQCTGSARSGAHRGGRRRPERLKLAGKHRMSMFYRPLVRLPVSRGTLKAALNLQGAPLCEAPARARNTRLLEVESDRSRAALRHRPLLPPCQRYPGDSCWPCQRLKHLRPTRRSSSQSGVQKPVGNKWETSGGGGSSWNGSPDFRRRRARSARASTLMGCGPSPPRRSPADDATSPASRSISSSSIRRPIHKPSDQEVEFALRS